MSPSPVPAPLAAAQVEPETSADGPAVVALVDAAFGPGRLAKTAERLREQAAIAHGFVLREAGRVVGSVRLWRITVGDRPALFLGPIAVEAGARRSGLGQALVRACLDAARADGAAGVLLVGDMPYFSRFGFEAAQGATLPGPVDPGRLLWLSLDGSPAVGPVRGRRD